MVFGTSCHLTSIQRNQNSNMKAAREPVEHSYAYVEKRCLLLTRKDSFKLDLDGLCVCAEMRVMFLLTNFKVCSAEGSTMTGARVFQ